MTKRATIGLTVVVVLVTAKVESLNRHSAREAATASIPQPANAAALTGFQGQDDARLRAMSVQTLSGRADALPVLAERVSNDPSTDVRMETIRSIGHIGNPAARDALTEIAQCSLDAALRQTAIQELGRAFGESALGVFDSLLTDPDETIRLSAVKGIARISSDRAATLLSRIASSDSSSTIRELAKLSLPTTR